MFFFLNIFIKLIHNLLNDTQHCISFRCITKLFERERAGSGWGAEGEEQADSVLIMEPKGGSIP